MSLEVYYMLKSQYMSCALVPIEYSLLLFCLPTTQKLVCDWVACFHEHMLFPVRNWFCLMMSLNKKIIY